MKGILSILFITFQLANICKAQEDPAVKQQRIEALKIAYITQKLDLSQAEAEKFWPVYYRYEAEMKQVRKDGENMDVIDKDEKMLNIRKKYKSEFSGVLGTGKANNLYRCENEFRSVLLRHMQHMNNVPRQNTTPVPVRPLLRPRK